MPSPDPAFLADTKNIVVEVQLLRSIVTDVFDVLNGVEDPETKCQQIAALTRKALPMRATRDKTLTRSMPLADLKFWLSGT